MILPIKNKANDHVWHLFVIRHPKRDQLHDILEARGIQTLIHYPVPPHRSVAYACDRKWLELPLATEIARTILSFPIGPHLRRDQMQSVSQVVDLF